MKNNLILTLVLLPFFSFGQAVLPTAWNFTTPGVATPPVGWTTNLGTGNQTYSGNGFSVGGDQFSLRLDATGEFLTIFFAEKPGPLSYYIRGTGFGANPPFAGTFKVQESVDGSAWTDIRTFTAMTSSLTRWQESLNENSRYVRFFYTEKLPNTNVALDSVMILKAPAPGVGVGINQQSNVILNGGTFIYGNNTSRVFTINNIGTSTNLNIDSITISGVNRTDFSLGAFDNSTPPGQNDTFRVIFNPQSNGSRFASINVYTNDASVNPFTFQLYAIGGSFASEPTVAPGSITISNLRTHAMNVSFSRASVAPERYIVLRKQAATITESPVDGITYKRGDYIGGAQVAFIGTDTALFRPNYILANTDYTFKVFAFNGPQGFENYLTSAAPSTTVKTPGATPGNYYAAINPLSSTFITDLCNRLRVPHDTVFYSNYIATMINNYLSRDTSDGRKVVDCIYTGIKHVYEEPFIWWTGNNSGTLTREHTWAQSWMPLNPVLGNGWPNVNGREVLEFNDLHNLFPAHQQNANARRSNNPFGIVVNATYTSPTGEGKLGTDSNSATVYEPKNDQKGDVARALLYMMVRYNGDRGYQWRLPSGQNINLLLQWHQQDPPSALEIARNEYIFSLQNNRNPFIDNPEWVNRINFNNLTYIPAPNVKLINLILPNGGQTYVAGSNQNITWNSQNIDTLVIEYRVDANSSWIRITDTVPASRGIFSWLVPNTPTTNALVRIFGKTDINIGDTSNATFTIDLPKSLQITTDVNNNTWIAGNEYTLTWTAVNVDTVLVQFAAGISPFVTLGKVAANSLSYTFNLNTPATTNGRFRIIQPSNPTVFSATTPFVVEVSSLTITDPINDASFIENMPVSVNINSSFIDRVDVYYTYRNNSGSMAVSPVGNFVTSANISFTPTVLSDSLVIVVREITLNKLTNFIAADTVKIKVSKGSGLDNILLNAIAVYPNPTQGKVMIDIPSGLQVEQIEVTDITGKVIITSSDNSISIANKGLYFVYIKTLTGTAVRKILVE